MYETDLTQPVNPMTGQHPKKFIGLWNLDVAVMEYHEKHGITYKSEIYTYVFKDGSPYEVLIESQEKIKIFVDKDWTTDMEPELKHWEARVHTKSFVIDGLGIPGEGRVFRSIGAAKKFIDADLKKFDKTA
jgi:hypothetical protein